MIPLVDLTLDKKLLDKITKEITRVVDSKNYILGAKLEFFEDKFANFIGVRYAIGVGNGTDALRLSLRALGIGRGDKVLTVSLTSPFTAISIVEEGAIPVFCDVDERTWTIDVSDAKKKIDKKTKAIIPVHLFGNPCDMSSIMEFAKEHNLKVIEDACQAHGAKYQEKMIGSFGDAAAFSFYPTKNLGAFGDGGMVTTNNPKVAKMIKLLRHGGQTKRFWHSILGTNSRLDEIQAAILSVKLNFLDEQNRKREQLAQRYKNKLVNIPVKFQEVLADSWTCNHLFILRTPVRKKLQRSLLNRRIGCDVYYPYPIHLQPAFKNYCCEKLPVTEKLAKEILAIPIYPGLTKEKQDYVIETVKKFFGQHKLSKAQRVS